MIVPPSAGHPPLPRADALVDPRVGDSGPALLALEDGTVRSLLVSIERVFHRDRGPFQRAVPILFVLMLSLVVAAAVVLWRDHRATAGAGRPEGSEGPEGLGPLPPHRKG